MKINNQIFTLAAMAVVFAPTAVAEEDAVSKLTQPDSSLSVGVGNLSGDREQFGMFDDRRDSDNELLLDADINKRDNATGVWTTFHARNLGLDHQSFDMGYERQGDWGVSLDYSEIPRIAPYRVNSGIIGLGEEMQSVPDVGYVPGTGSDIELRTERERTGLSFFKYLTPDLNLKVNFKNEEKDGDRHWGRGGQAEFAAEPVDASNRTLETTLSYSGDNFQTVGGYIGNWYRNNNDLLTTTNGSDTYNLTLPLDTEAHQFFVNGGYSFDATTRGTFRVSYTRASVDESLPTADISGLAWDGVTLGSIPHPAAPTDLDAGIDTTLVFLGLTSRPVKNLSLVTNVRYHEVNETTSRDLIVCRRCDDADDTNNQIAHSTPLDYKTLSGKLEATYRLPQGYSLIGGVDLRNQERTVPVGELDAGLDTERYVPWRKDVDEMTYRIQLRKSMSETVNGALMLAHSKRDGSSYVEAEHSEPGEGITNEAIDPINIADRDRNKVRATLDWAPSERVSLQFNLEASRDDYTGHTLGLRDGEGQVASVDATFILSQDWVLTSWYSYDRTEAEQRNHRHLGTRSPTYSEAEMYDEFEDVGNSFGLGLEGTVNEKLKVGANFDWTRNSSEYDQTLIPVAGSTADLYPAGGSGPLPDIKSTATKLELFADYVLTDNSDLRFNLVHETWKTDDWTWEFSDGSPFTYGTTRDGTQVIQDSRQSSTFVGMQYVYKFK